MVQSEDHYQEANPQNKPSTSAGLSDEISEEFRFDSKNHLSQDVSAALKQYIVQDKKGDPFFVADLEEIDRLYRDWCIELPCICPHYSVKCNNDPKLIERLASKGASFDCASIAELDLILSRGISPERIVFAHTIKSPQALQYARLHGVRDLTFDNVDELHKIAAYYPEANLLLRISANDPTARYQLSKKFGATTKSASHLLSIARDLKLQITGIAFHIGCEAQDGTAYKKAIRAAKELIVEGSSLGHCMTTLDIGGGYSKKTLPGVARAIRDCLAEDDLISKAGIRVIAEPGTYFAASVFTLACNVMGRRVGEKADDVSSDMLYLNEGLWGSFTYLFVDDQKPIPRLLESSSASAEARPHAYMVWGPTCDSSDKILDNYTFPREVLTGDWVYFENMGAYTLTCSTSFNGLHPTSHVVYIDTERGPVDK